jgi:tRNA (cmo5U34)-methyltransferase
MKPSDQVFSDKIKDVADFHFGEKVATVFDDMVGRSVPFYHEMQRMIAEMAGDFAVNGSNVYDLGCATGTTMLHLDSHVPEGVRFVGIDNSEEMLAKCAAKLKEENFTRDHELKCADLNQDLQIENASMVLLVLTL